MDNLVEQIAKEVMLRIKSQSANRGGSYTPPPTSISQTQNSDPNKSIKETKKALLITANIKVIDFIIQNLQLFTKDYNFLILSDYVYQNYIIPQNLPNLEIVNSSKIPANKLVHEISEITIPSLSINTMAKAANLIADSYATQVISFALCEGIPVIVTDESILEAGRYFPTAIAKKIDTFRRELEILGIRFQRGNILIKPEHKCTTCSITTTCSLCQPRQETNKQQNFLVQTNECLKENCPRTYGSCSATCVSSVKQIVDAGAERIEKGLDAPIPAPELAKYIDHTLLKPNATEAEIIKLCEEAKKYGFASVCVNPSYVSLASKLLKGSSVKVCTVVGFPLGATSTFTKVMETRDAIANGANEIDMVINVGALKSKNYDLVKSDIARVVEAAAGNCVKVIIETALLTNEEKIKACELAKEAGADFVKTSTGFSSGGATVEDVELMRKVVGPNMGVKASGGIRDYQTAQQMIKAGATRIGASASVAIIKGEQSTSTKTPTSSSSSTGITSTIFTSSASRY